MKMLLVVVGFVLLCTASTFGTTPPEHLLNQSIKQLSEFLQNAAPKNTTANTTIKKQIVQLLQNINATTAAENDERRSLSVFATKVAFTKRALLYIKDNVTADEKCEECVKEPDINPLTNPFILLINPDAWNKTDYFISELLVDAAVSLKALGEGRDAERYKMKLFCKAQRLFDSSEKEIQLPDDQIDLTTLLTNTTTLLQRVDVKNQTKNRAIAKEISVALKTLDPLVCEDGAAAIDNLRKVKKIFFCQKVLIHLKADNARQGVKNCGDCVRYPDTRPLIELLGEFTAETAGRINDFIGRLLVDVAVDLGSLGEGLEYDEYRKTLDFNIARLNLTW